MRTTALITCLFFYFNATYSQQVIYVDSAASGANNGNSWLNAFTDLQDALAAADSTDEIWVAMGTYYPSDTSRVSPFIMKSGVSLYGGFNGSEVFRDQRDWVLYKTVLSGDLGVKGDSSDNSNKIIFARYLNGIIEIDGFTIEHGRAVLSASPSAIISVDGAGLWADESNLIVSNCTFRKNYAEGAGGAMYLNYGEINIINCVFEYNTAKGYSGAIRTNNVEGNVVNCLFYRNKTIGDIHGNGSAGAVSIDGSTWINCIFRENHAFSSGGGAFIEVGTLINCLFENNSAGRSGGAVRVSSSPGFIYDCQFVNNFVTDSNQNGGAVYLDFGFGGAYEFELYNSRFLNNRATRDGGAIYLYNTKARMQNCEFVNNSALRNGGAIFYYSGTGKCSINNCSFYSNTAGASGQVIYDFATYFDSTKVTNCIFWNNSLPEIENHPNSKPLLLRNSIIQSAYPGLALLNADPQFTNPLGTDSILGTLDDNFRLLIGSPAIEAGTPDTSGLYLVSADLDNNPRINGIIDLGVYEYNDCSLTVSQADAGTDSTFCFPYSTLLNATPPAVGAGRWGWVNSFGFPENPYSPYSRVSNLHFGDNAFEWSVSYCGNVTRDTVVITMVRIPSTPVVNVIGSSTICTGDTAWLRVMNPVSGYSYTWSNGTTGDTIFVSQGGNYRVTATSAPGCSSQASSSVSVTAATAPSKPAVTVTGSLDLCEGTGQSVTLRVSSTFSNYYWSNGATARQITVDTAGSFFVRVKNSSGCLSPYSDTMHVNLRPLPPTPVLTQTGLSLFCAGDSTLVEGTAGSFTFHWSDGRTTPSVWITQTQSLHLYVTDSYGCRSENSDTLSFQVINMAQPQISVTSSTTFCIGDSATLSIPASYSFYHWSTGDSTNQVVVKQSGSYTVYVGDTNSCHSPVSDAVTISVENNPAKPAVTVQGQLSFCQGQSVTLQAPAGYASYEWSNGLNNQSITLISSGTYYVRVTNSSGCVSVFSDPIITTVFPNPPKPVVTVQGELSFCQGQSVTLQAPAGYASYEWTTGSGNQSITPMSSGTYRVRVTNSNGCVSVFSDPIITTVFPNPPQPVITRSHDTLTTESYSSYQWLLNGNVINNATSQQLHITENGNYSVIVTDSNGCSSTSEVVTGDGIEARDNFKVKLYPNPNNGKFVLEFSDNEASEVSMTDMLGRLIISDVYVQKHTEFNIDKAPEGIFFLRIIRDRQVLTIKVNVIR